MEAGTHYPSAGRRTQVAEGQRAGTQHAARASPDGECRKGTRSTRGQHPEPGLTRAGRAPRIPRQPLPPPPPHLTKWRRQEVPGAWPAPHPPPAARPAAQRARAPGPRCRPCPGGQRRPQPLHYKSPRGRPAAAAPTARAAPADFKQAPGPRSSGLPAPAPRRWRRWWRTGSITQCRLRGPRRGALRARLATAKDTGPHLRR